MASEDQILKEFGSNLRRLRKSAKIPMTMLEVTAGIDRSNISKIENGNKTVELITIIKLIKALDVKPEQIITPELVKLLDKK